MQIHSFTIPCYTTAINVGDTGVNSSHFPMQVSTATPQPLQDSEVLVSMSPSRVSAVEEEREASHSWQTAPPGGRKKDDSV